MSLHKTFILRDAAISDRCFAFIRSVTGGEMLIAVTVAEAKKPRSRDQNDYARALVRSIAEQAWVSGRQFSPEAWWEQLGSTFGPVDEMELPSGEIKKVRKSTTGMSVKEFARFIEDIQHYAADVLGLELER